MVATASAPAQQQTSNQAPGLANQTRAQSLAIAQVRAVLSSGLQVAAMLPVLTGVLGAQGISEAITAAALMLTLRAARTFAGTSVFGVALGIVAGWELSYRAAYLVHAAQRMQQAANRGADVAAAVAAETPFYRMHLHASVNRRDSAAKVDVLAKRAGGLLGWKAVMDSRTSLECRLADGHNFRVSDPPVIGYPGAVHPHCRCKPVPPFAGADLVDNVLAAQRQPIAV